MGKTAPMIPSWALTIGGIQSIGGNVQVWCGTCHQQQRLDLARLIAAVGPGYSLLNRRCRCRLTPSCPGWNRFRYSAGEHCMAWNLCTDAGVQRWIDRDYAARQEMARLMREQAAEREHEKALRRH